MARQPDPQGIAGHVPHARPRRFPFDRRRLLLIRPRGGGRRDRNSGPRRLQLGRGIACSSRTVPPAERSGPPPLGDASPPRALENRTVAPAPRGQRSTHSRTPIHAVRGLDALPPGASARRGTCPQLTLDGVPGHRCHTCPCPADRSTPWARTWDADSCRTVRCGGAPRRREERDAGTGFHG